jgi:hypothetical protein
LTKKTKGQRSAAQKKVDYGAYNVGLRQVQELDEKNAFHHPMDRTAKQRFFFGSLCYPKTHRITDRSECRQSATSESAAIQRPEIKEL